MFRFKTVWSYLGYISFILILLRTVNLGRCTLKSGLSTLLSLRERVITLNLTQTLPTVRCLEGVVVSTLCFPTVILIQNFT